MSSPSPPQELALARGFYNCAETPEPVQLSVTGKIPEWLNGVLYRTGPGTYSIPVDGTEKTFQILHWFDGLSMHHRFEIRSGQVEYRSKKGATAEEEYIKKNGMLPVAGSFGQSDPCQLILGKFFTKFKRSYWNTPAPEGPTSNNVGVTLTAHFTGLSAPESSLISKTDANILQVLDPVTLEPLKITSYKKILPELDGQLSAAHAGIEDGDFYNFTLTLGRKHVYKVFRIDSQGKPSILAEITDAPAAYIHTTFVTRRYVVLVVWQADYKMGGLPILINEALTVNTLKRWSDSRKTLFYVIDRKKGGIVGRYQTDPFFAFHSLNSYDDEDGSVVIDIACYRDTSVLGLLKLENLRALGSNPNQPLALDASARRFRLENVQSSLSTGSDTFIEAKVDFDLGTERNVELPVVAPSVANKPYKYTYGIHTHRNDLPLSLANSIIKIDVTTGATRLWVDENHVPGEPIFVPRPGGSSEDAGVLMTVALDGSKGTSALIVIDAETMKEVARAEMKIPFPFGFHGTFTAHS